MVRVLTIATILALIIRIASQMQTGSENLYFAGRDVFECVAIWSWYYFLKVKRVMAFMLGLAIYNLIEPLFGDPTLFDIREYVGFMIGLLFFITQVIYDRYKRAGK